MRSSRWSLVLLILVVALGLARRSAARAPEGAEASTSDPSPDVAPGTATSLAPQGYKQGWRVGVIPLWNYSSDTGMGFGAGVALYDYGDGTAEPFENSLFVKGFMTTRWVHHHALQWDSPDCFGTGVKLRLKASFEKQIDTHYFGIGNTTTLIDDLAAEGLDGHYYQYRHTTPVVLLSLSFPLVDSLALRSGYSFFWSTIDPYEGSLLEVEEPLGAEGGVLSMIHLGLVYDTRDKVYDTRHGHWIELSARYASSWLGAMTDFVGFTFVTRQYWNPFGGFVIANRLIGDVLVGDVPFFYLERFGDAEDTEGLGGAWSMRGFAADRWVGSVKVVENFELRQHLLQWFWGNHRFDVGAVLFMDAGRVWKGWSADGDWWDIHVAGGGGIRLVWNENLLFRAEMGGSVEGMRFFIEAFTLF